MLGEVGSTPSGGFWPKSILDPRHPVADHNRWMSGVEILRLSRLRVGKAPPNRQMTLPIHRIESGPVESSAISARDFPWLMEAQPRYEPRFATIAGAALPDTSATIRFTGRRARSARWHNRRRSRGHGSNPIATSSPAAVGLCGNQRHLNLPRPLQLVLDGCVVPRRPPRFDLQLRFFVCSPPASPAPANPGVPHSCGTVV